MQIIYRLKSTVPVYNGVALGPCMKSFESLMYHQSLSTLELLMEVNSHFCLSLFQIARNVDGFFYQKSSRWSYFSGIIIFINSLKHSKIFSLNHKLKNILIKLLD